MNQAQKDEILFSARTHVATMREAITQSLEITARQLKQGKEDFKSLSPSDQVTSGILLAYGEKRLGELEILHPSPYFVRCDVLFLGEHKKRSIYFAKFPLSEREIYSWTAPVATIRFEGIGDVTYTLPDGDKQKGKLLRKDQYMIVDGKIVFLATESNEAQRELVYQEHFSSRKQGFMLPEIVAQMEKAQDQVIRAHHIGSFAISGPAGSGKTTLALHRVAYLVQSPDTAHLYPSKSILIFVQDIGTQKYFSQLLPELGIRDVTITTFDAWAMNILDLSGKADYVRHYGTTEQEKDGYEYAKIEALRKGVLPPQSKQFFAALESLYTSHFDVHQNHLFQQQKQEKILDRIDLTALLMIHAHHYGNLGKVRDYYIEQKNGSLKKKRGRVPFEYALIVVDEFQNSLPEQLKLFKQCVDPKLQSLIYVGDMAQKIHFGTIRNWDDIGEAMTGEQRSVVLQKVYRNTKNILRYIQGLGYTVEIPEGMREGEPVQEYHTSSIEEEIDCVKSIREKCPKMSIGILSKDGVYLEPFKKVFGNEESVHVFTMEESQGAEFDIVCIVGMNREDWTTADTNGISQEFTTEKQKILKDLLYVALTRAISELHVIGGENFKK
jgi:DNA helicase IV